MYLLMYPRNANLPVPLPNVCLLSLFTLFRCPATRSLPSPQATFGIRSIIQVLVHTHGRSLSTSPPRFYPSPWHCACRVLVLRLSISTRRKHSVAGAHGVLLTGYWKTLRVTLRLNSQVVTNDANER